MARRTAALPPHSAPVPRRCWPHRGPRSGAPASRAIPLLIVSNPVFSAVADIESCNYNWMLLWFGASQFFSTQQQALLAATLARCQRCGHRRLAQRQRAARQQRARPSVALFTTNRHSLECSRGAPNLLKLLAHHLLASYTHAHPSMHVTSIAVTHTHVYNTVSDTFPALT
jgi:DNA-directed RNA polymerase subunit RPC12/RpoP